MARGQVAAFSKGIIYQARFFWYQAAMLLRDESAVRRVTIEHDKVSRVDDVAVFYAPPGVDAGGTQYEADFYQVKFHVDRRDAYCHQILINAENSSSLLERLYEGYNDAKDEHSEFRLHLLSNWGWKHNDPIASSIRSSNGALPEKFFTDSKRAKLGKIREKWRDHLGINSDKFEAFARRLRFDLDYWSGRRFRKVLSDRLASVGLKPMPEHKRSNPYDSLGPQLLLDETHTFDREQFLNFCKTEELYVGRSGIDQTETLGVRSFIRSAERIGDETDDFVCVAENFNGRYLDPDSDWQTDVLPPIRQFFGKEALMSEMRQREHHLLLECHASLSLFAGYELDRKSGAQVYPLQKWPERRVWKPEYDSEAQTDWSWKKSEVELSSDASGVAIALSVSNRIQADVTDFLGQSSLQLQKFVDFRPQEGVGHSSIANADHARYLAEQLVQSMSHLRRDTNADLVHLFTSAPNALLYFLGQHRSALGEIQLYEYDFEGRRDWVYTPSITLPLDQEGT